MDHTKTAKGKQTEGAKGGNWKRQPHPAAKDTLPAELARAIEDLLGFVWERHFRYADEEDIDADLERIFRSRLKVENWLYGHDTEPEGGW